LFAALGPLINEHDGVLIVFIQLLSETIEQTTIAKREISMLCNNMSHIDAAQETIFNKLTSQFPKQKVPSSP